MHTVGRLARQFGLSRSALLYYDRIGLLRPSQGGKGDYRRYSEDDRLRLEKICLYRDAGIPLDGIRALLDGPAPETQAILDRQLTRLKEEIDLLNRQRRLVAALLGAVTDASRDASWETVLRQGGFSGEDIRLWASSLEHEEHQLMERLLESLRIPPAEIDLIRALAGGTQRIQQLHIMSGEYMDAFYTAFKDIPRVSPGDFDSTQRAFRMIPALPPAPRILVIGCGTGVEVTHLARLCDGTITAIDTWDYALERTRAAADASGVSDRVVADLQNMSTLPYEKGSFDLIWAEGAIYLMGFDYGLGYLKQFLKPGGCIAVSELTWLEDDVPAEPRVFWRNGYPQMRHDRDNRDAFDGLGYDLLGTFTLPDESWWRDFYTPLGRRLDMLERDASPGSQMLEVIAGNREEMTIVKNYSQYFGYVFYVAQRR